MCMYGFSAQVAASVIPTGGEAAQHRGRPAAGMLYLILEIKYIYKYITHH